MTWKRWIPEVFTFQIIASLVLMAVVLVAVYDQTRNATQAAQAQLRAVQAQTLETRREARCNAIIMLDVLRGLAQQAHLDVRNIPIPNPDGLNCRAALLRPFNSPPLPIVTPRRSGPSPSPSPLRSPSPSPKPSPTPFPSSTCLPIIGCIPTS